MTKAFMKILTIMITGLIFTFGLIGCTRMETILNQRYLIRNFFRNQFCFKTFSTEELEIAKRQVPAVIDILINATLNEEPIKDGSRMSMESIWRFIFQLQILNKKEIRILPVYIGKKSIKICSGRRHRIYDRM